MFGRFHGTAASGQRALDLLGAAGQPVSRPLGLATQPLELAARPADDIEIDPLQGRTQLRLVEVAVVVDPAANARIVHLGQVLQGLVAAMMKRPAPNSHEGNWCQASIGLRHGTCCRLIWSPRQPSLVLFPLYINNLPMWAPLWSCGR